MSNTSDKHVDRALEVIMTQLSDLYGHLDLWDSDGELEHDAYRILNVLNEDDLLIQE